MGKTLRSVHQALRWIGGEVAELCVLAAVTALMFGFPILGIILAVLASMEISALLSLGKAALGGIFLLTFVFLSVYVWAAHLQAAIERAVVALAESVR